MTEKIGPFTYSEMKFWMDRQRSDCEGARMLTAAIAEVRRQREEIETLTDQVEFFRTKHNEKVDELKKSEGLLADVLNNALDAGME